MSHYFWLTSNLKSWNFFSNFSQKTGSVYSVEFTTLCAHTKRKQRMAEKKLRPTKLRLKDQKPLKTEAWKESAIHATAHTLRNTFFTDTYIYSYISFSGLSAFQSDQSQTQFFFQPFSHAAILRLKTAKASQFSLRNSRTPNTLKKL